MANGTSVLECIAEQVQRTHDRKTAELAQRIAERVIEIWPTLRAQMLDVAEFDERAALDYERQELARQVAAVIRQ